MAGISNNVARGAGALRAGLCGDVGFGAGGRAAKRVAGRAIACLGVVLAVLVTALSLVASPASARAASGSRTGSISLDTVVQTRDGSRVLAGDEFSLAQVATATVGGSESNPAVAYVTVDAFKAVDFFEEAAAVGEVVPGACNRRSHGESPGACDAVSHSFHGLHVQKPVGAVCGKFDVGMSCDKVDARFEFADHGADPGRLHDAVGVGEKEDFPFGGGDEFCDGVLFGAFTRSEFRDRDYVNAVWILFCVFGKNLRGAVGGTVVCNPDVPTAFVKLLHQGVQGLGNSRFFVPCGYENTDRWQRISNGIAQVDFSECTEKTHFKYRIEKGGDNHQNGKGVFKNNPKHAC